MTDRSSAIVRPASNVQGVVRIPGDKSVSHRYAMLAAIASGKTNAQIAKDLYLSAKTVMHHSTSIYRKLGVRGRAEAVALAFRDGLLHASDR